MNRAKIIADSSRIDSLGYDNSLMDNFFISQSHSCIYNSIGWTSAIEKSYDLRSYTFFLNKNLDIYYSSNPFIRKGDKINGYISMIHIKGWFSDALVSMPFCDAGGIIAIDERSERILIEKSLRIASDLNIPILELRQYQSLSCMNDCEFVDQGDLGRPQEIKSVAGWYVSQMPYKNRVRMILYLPDSSNFLMKSFKSKLRNQILKPIKEKLILKIGSIELIDDFYKVFAENMRDLGSPVHSKKFILEVLKFFQKNSNIFIVYSDKKPLASSLTIGFRDTLSNPWASFLRRYSHLGPNMLLYWSMLEFACQNGYRCFDFGRSTFGEGTYKFKEQWGAKPEPLYWYRFSKTNDQSWDSHSDKNKMSKAIEYWKKLPVPLTKFIGPRIRKYISL